MFDADVKFLPKRLWIPSEEEEKEMVLQPQRTEDGKLVIGFVEEYGNDNHPSS